MRTISLFLFASLVATSVDAAWYQKIDGTKVDPILDVFGYTQSYSGPNLQPGVVLPDAAYLRFAVLTYADLSSADLAGANLAGALLDGGDLSSADLTGADLWGASLTQTDLSSADLTGANLDDAYLTYADLSSADLSGSDFSNVFLYTGSTWTDAFYYTDNEPTWASGMDAAWRSSAGILATPPVPEPAAILLALLGLALLPRRRRR
jgi:hypothetical protein